MEWLEGDVTGLLPYSRLVTPPGDTVAEEPTEIFAVPRECLHPMGTYRAGRKDRPETVVYLWTP